ncbi:MAG: hypothetical protein HOW73_38750 [Polyangiaceae bacterium]|nr:hypothetical protein [Polyangiaceae bacterium]
MVDGKGTRGDKPRVHPRLFVVAALLATSVMAPSLAHAQGAPPQVPGLPGADEMEEREGRPKPYAEDFRTGHVYIDGVSSAIFPVGSVAPGSSIRDIASYGFTAGGAIGFGISRHAEVDLRGSYGLLAGPGECESCSSNVAAASIGFTYHLTQGASFDPWIRLGSGYRTFELEHGEDETARVLAIANGRYHGVDIAQLSLGADFFPVPGFGFGPWFEADMGTFVAWPDGSTTGTRIYGFFLLGLELELDPVQWLETSGPATPATPPAKTAWSDVPRF